MKFRCKEKNEHYYVIVYRICRFLQGNTPNRLQVLSRRSGFFLKRKKKTKTKTSIIVCFVAFTFFHGSDNFAATHLYYFTCRGFSSQISCCDTADVVNWANPRGDKHINRR